MVFYMKNTNRLLKSKHQYFKHLKSPEKVRQCCQFGKESVSLSICDSHSAHVLWFISHIFINLSVFHSEDSVAMKKKVGMLFKAL